MKKLFATVVALAAAAFVSGNANATLTGTSMNVSMLHSQFTAQSMLAPTSYTYGNATGMNVVGWGTVQITSPAAAVGFDNAMKLDFTNFGYITVFSAFPANGTVILTGLAEGVDLSSVKVQVNGSDVGFGAAAAAGGFQVSWTTAAALAGSAINPSVTVAWNSVPGPGSFALLGLAGLVSRRGRRR